MEKKKYFELKKFSEAEIEKESGIGPISYKTQKTTIPVQETGEMPILDVEKNLHGSQQSYTVLKVGDVIKCTYGGMKRRVESYGFEEIITKNDEAILTQSDIPYGLKIQQKGYFGFCAAPHYLARGRGSRCEPYIVTDAWLETYPNVKAMGKKAVLHEMSWLPCLCGGIIGSDELVCEYVDWLPVEDPWSFYNAETYPKLMMLGLNPEDLEEFVKNLTEVDTIFIDNIQHLFDSAYFGRIITEDELLSSLYVMKNYNESVVSEKLKELGFVESDFLWSTVGEVSYIESAYIYAKKEYILRLRDEAIMERQKIEMDILLSSLMYPIVDRVLYGPAYMSVDDFLKLNVPGNFQRSVKNAFTDDAKVTTLTEDLTVYRYYGNGSNPKSFWVTPNKYVDPASTLALPSANSAENMATFTIPKGTTILEGTVAPNFGQVGGGYQFYVPNPSVLY